VTHAPAARENPMASAVARLNHVNVVQVSQPESAVTSLEQT